MDRGMRRARTERVIRRRVDEFQHASWFRHVFKHPHKLAKRAPLACGCSKRKFGCPRVDRGMCDAGSRVRIYRLRSETRALQILVAHHWVDWDADEAALLTYTRRKSWKV